MHTPHLGPHSFRSPEPHGRHHEWLTRFTPRQRHDLIAEDRHGRNQAFGILAGAMIFGLTAMLVTLMVAVAM